jgi:hypothetical protein
VNDVGEVYLPSTQYIVTKYHDEGLRYARLLPKCKVVVSKGNRGSLGSSDLPEMENLFTFEHNMNRCEETNVFSGWPNQNPDALFVSWSSITSAMHFAAYLGAKNIIMVAHDCGTLGEKDWVKGYPYENWDQSEIEQAKQRNKLFEINYENWMYFSHDWLIYFFARIKNYNVIIDDRAEILYRIHSSNVHGQLNINSLTAIFRRLQLINQGWYFKQIDNFSQILDKNSREYIIYYLYKKNWLSRIGLLIKYNFKLIRSKKKFFQFFFLSLLPRFK